MSDPDPVRAWLKARIRAAEADAAAGWAMFHKAAQERDQLRAELHTSNLALMEACKRLGIEGSADELLEAIEGETCGAAWPHDAPGFRYDAGLPSVCVLHAGHDGQHETDAGGTWGRS